jgi:NTP pyrophosphatase (non-canonical NTP hydrolase)
MEFSQLIQRGRLWSVIVLANVHGIDLEEAFLHTMDDLEQWTADQ